MPEINFVIGNKRKPEKKKIMHTHADKKQDNKSQSVSNEVSQKQSGGQSAFKFVDNRPEAVAQRKLHEMANYSPQMKQAAQLQAIADNNVLHSPTQAINQNLLSGQLVQRLSIEYYTQAQITFGGRATEHISEQEIRNYLALYHEEIVVGEGQTIKIGKGRETGYEVWGNIKYNCSYSEDHNCHFIHVWHAHEGQKMG